MKMLLIIVALVGGSALAYPAPSPTLNLAPRVPKIKIFRSNPHRLTAIRLQGTNPYDAPDDDFICSSVARRPKIVKHKINDWDLSDYVLVRLAVARARAMQKYRDTWT